jgi:hypothetical protein
LIKNTCDTQATQIANVKIKEVNGSVYLVDDSIKQIAGALTSCITATVQSAAASSATTATVSQQADATAVGMNLNFLMALIVAAVVVLGGGVAYFGQKNIPLIVSLVMMSAGGGAVIMGYQTSKVIMTPNTFSKLVSGTCPGLASVMSTTTAATTDEALAKCRDTTGCAGVDVQAYTTTPNGKSFAQFESPLKVTLYSSIPTECNDAFTTQDKTELIVDAVYGQGPGEPSINSNYIAHTLHSPNIYLNTNNSDLYVFNHATGKWDLFAAVWSQIKESAATTAEFSDGTITNPAFNTQVGASQLKIQPSTNLAYFDVFGKQGESGSVRIKGPSYLTIVPPQVNVAARASMHWQTWMMGGGGAVAAFGAILMVLFLITSRSTKTTQPSSNKPAIAK